MMKRFISGLGLAIVALVTWAPHARADDRALTLTAAPTAVTLFPGKEDTQTVAVVARLAKGQTIAAAELKVLPVPGVRVEVANPGTRFPTGDELVWTLTVWVEPDITGSTTQTVRVDYKTAGDTAAASVDFASFTLTPRARAAAASVAEASILKDFSSLFEVQQSRAYLKVRNLTDAPLAVQKVEILHPKFVHVTHTQEPWQVPARGTLVEPLEITLSESDPKSPLRVGDYNLVALLSLAAASGTSQWTGSVSAESAITVGIPGWSDVQALVQTPSFLLLPGVLVLGMIAALAQVIGGTAPAGLFGASGLLSVRSPQFWIVSVTISIGIVLLYPWATGGRDVLLGYGLTDVIRVWLGSIAIGALIYVLGVGVYLLVKLAASMKQRRLAREQAQRAFQSADDPIVVLERLERLGKSAVLPSATDATRRLFRLGVDDAASGKEWAVPQGALRSLAAGQDQLLIDIADALEKGDPSAILFLVRDEITNERLAIGWRQSDGSGPRLVDKTFFQHPEKPAAFVEVE
jgi:hypothetical protein